jgi:uncharacterized RDD family membrane protein YckC
MEALDQPLIKTDESAIKYGDFFPRLGAQLLDALVIAPVSFGVTYFNITSWKSPLLLVVLTLITVAYKPFLEFTYGATLGKMALNLKVVNLQHERANLTEILIRNSFYIVPSLVTLFLSIVMYNEPEFQSITGFMEYSAYAQQFPASKFISMATTLFVVVDGIVMVADDRKRSLHDKVAKTYVIKLS